MSSTKKITEDEFLKKVENKNPNSYELVGEYINTYSKVKMRHKCGNIIEGVANLFYRTHNYCKICNTERRANEQRMPIEKISEKLNSIDYKLLSEKYVNSNEKLKILCDKGHIFNMRWSHINRGVKCPTCKGIDTANRQRRPIEEVYKIIKQSEYKFVEFPNGYNSEKSKVTVECLKGHITTKGVYNIIIGYECPHCKKSSKSEKEIEEYLLSKGIAFEQQYKFDDCKNINSLPFDFAIFKESSLAFILEFDGKQHFQPVDIFGGIKNFIKVVKNDNIKNLYCKQNNIPLIRISYKQRKNIIKILDEIFSRLDTSASISSINYHYLH